MGRTGWINTSTTPTYITQTLQQLASIRNTVETGYMVKYVSENIGGSSVSVSPQSQNLTAFRETQITFVVNVGANVSSGTITITDNTGNVIERVNVSNMSAGSKIVVGTGLSGVVPGSVNISTDFSASFSGGVRLSEKVTNQYYAI